MSGRRQWLRSGGWWLAGLTGAMLAAGLVLLISYLAAHPGGLPVHVVVPVFYNVPLVLAFTVVATAVLRRLPEHPIGWLFGLVGVGIAGGFLAEGYAAWSLPGLSWVLWLWVVLNGPIFFGLAMALLVFPTGAPPSPRWRPLAALLWLYLATGVLVAAVAPWSREPEFLVVAVAEQGGWPVHNPLGWPGEQWLADASGLVVPAGVVLLAAALVSLLPRWRYAAGDERQQIKWLGLAGLVATLEIVAGLVQSLIGQMPESDPAGELVGNAVFVLVIGGLPVAVGLGIVRYRLYDIDAIISRTLAYGGLAGLIGLGYLAGVVAASELAGRWTGSSTLPALAVAAAVAALFHPLRAQLQAGADRLVFGRRAAPYELMTRFGHQLGHALAPPDLLARIAETAGRAARARAARVTTTLPDGSVLTGHWPAGEPPDPAGLELVVPVQHDGAAIGQIAVAATDPRPADLTLLRDTAAISAGALRNLRLLAELDSLHQTIRQQNRQIAASQRRLVAAAQQERHRLERQVATRVGPDLAVLRQALPELRELVGRQPAAVVAGCARQAARAGRVLDELRALSRSVLPPVLADLGLAAALRALLRRLDREVALDLAPPVAGRRFPAAVETTAYLACRAAVEAAAPPVRTELRIALADGVLVFSVTHSASCPATDDLTAAQDRVTALGGELLVGPGDGRWSAATGRLPVGTGPVPVPAH